MSNAVKSLSAPLAQCVKHRSSNQTLTGSNLAEYPLFIFFCCCYHEVTGSNLAEYPLFIFFVVVIIISLFSFFIRFYSSFFMESI